MEGRARSAGDLGFSYNTLKSWKPPQQQMQQQIRLSLGAHLSLYISARCGAFALSLSRRKREE
jgi:hypothetical protein